MAASFPRLKRLERGLARLAPVAAAMGLGAMLVLAGASFAGGGRATAGLGPCSLDTLRRDGVEGLVDVARRLDARERAIARRESAQSGREADLGVIERRIEGRLDELKSTRDAIDALLHEADERRETRVTALVDIVGGMKPTEAASMMLDLDPDLAVEVLARLDGPKASKVLAAMPPKSSAALADRMVADPLRVGG